MAVERSRWEPIIMRKLTLITVFVLAVTPSLGQDLRSTLFDSTEAAMEAAREAQADILAPASFNRGSDSLGEASEFFSRGRNIDRIRSMLDAARNSFEEAIEAAEIAKITLAALIKTRDDAENASASTFAGELWGEAEELFESAVRRLETGDIRASRTRADEAEALYRDAELTAIKAQYLSETRAILAQADRLRVPRYAPRTYERARTLLQQAELELNDNRYDTDYPRSLAQQANYEARHAIFLAERIQLMRDNDQTEEDIILDYEEPLTQIAAATDRVARLDQGVEPLVSELVSYIEELRESARQLEFDVQDSMARIAELEEEMRQLDEQLGGVSQERVALVQRLEAEARIREQFTTIEQLFTRDEARVSREGNNITLRLVGLTFASGQSTVDEAYRPLLEKVRQAATIFPRSQIVIEGHTDSYGGDVTNLALSRARAEAVSAFLATELGVQTFRMSAVGYGETRPIANNETPQGRARNRRIEVRIEPQLE
jgi:OOP family OmpA-OmpF porin